MQLYADGLLERGVDARLVERYQVVERRLDVYKLGFNIKTRRSVTLLFQRWPAAASLSRVNAEGLTLL